MKNTFKKNIERTLSIFLAIFLLLGTIPIFGVSAAEVTSNFEYTLLDDGTIEVTKYVGTDSYAIIPDEIDGKPVTKVNEFCFFNDDDYNGLNYTVKSIFISKNITDFSDTLNNGEYRCLNRILYLESIRVDERNLVYSSDSGILFSKDFTTLIYYPRCKTGGEYIVPEYVKELGRSAFSELRNLHSLKFNSFFEKMGDAAIFSGNIEEAEYPVYPEPSSRIILFSFCTELTKVYISKDVKWMNEYDFMQSPNVTLYVYNNSYALDWAKEHGFAYEIMEEPPIEKDLVDEGTGIKVKGTMDPDANLKVEKVESTVENAVATYDITLRKDGDVIQPSGTITISIPSEIKDCKLFWVKDDGTKVEVNAKYENGKYVFTTDHLSVYALVKEPEATTVAPPETTLPEPTVTEPIETTVPVPTATEPIETTVPIPTATEPIETTVPEPTVTEPIETTVPEPTVTESIETTVPEPIETTVPEPTATEPIETTVPEPTVTEQVETTVAPPETTVESATDKVEPTKSVATPDTPNNNSNSGSSSGSSSASINNSSIVATGDMLGASNLLLLSIIVMSATTGVSVILFRRKKEKVSNK